MYSEFTKEHVYLRETERKRNGKEEKKTDETVEKDKINSIEF